MPRRSERRRTAGLVEVARATGHVSVRMAAMEPERRYKIDVQDEQHPTVYLNAARSDADLAAAWPEIAARLVGWHRDQRRRDLYTVDDIELVEDDVALERAVGDEDAVEVTAAARRARFGILDGGLGT